MTLINKIKNLETHLSEKVIQIEEKKKLISEIASLSYDTNRNLHEKILQ